MQTNKNWRLTENGVVKMVNTRAPKNKICDGTFISGIIVTLQEVEVVNNKERWCSTKLMQIRNTDMSFSVDAREEKRNGSQRQEKN